jgi:hypothetical protein
VPSGALGVSPEVYLDQKCVLTAKPWSKWPFYDCELISILSAIYSELTNQIIP